MNLQNLKIGTLLKLGFGIIVLLIVILSGIALNMNNQLAQQTTDLAYHPFTVTKALGKLDLDIMAMRLEFRNLLLATDENSRQTAIINTDLYEADAKKQFNILYDRYLGPRSDIEMTEKAFLRWVSARKSNRETRNVAEAMNRLQSTGDIGTERDQMLLYIKKMEDFANDKSDHFAESALKLKETLNLQMGYLVAGILALSVLIVYILNRVIRRPIDELTNVAQLFKEGEMSVRSQYVSRNEYGMLSSTFNDLAENIETEMTLNNQTAKLSGIMLSQEDARQFCNALLSRLIEYSGSQMAAFYLLSDDKTEFNHFESIGLEKEACKPFSANLFEGEFGQALASQKLQLLKNIPADTRFSFSTVTGKYVPKEIMTIPIVSGNETIAIISLATVKGFTYNTLRLINSILSTLSARLDGILSYRKIITFSKKLEEQNQELETQKRELSLQTNELTEQNIELEMQKKQLDEANRMKSSFLSNMSHELRTPLNSVIALSGVLSRRLNGKVPTEEFSYLEVIERNGKQLLALINDILDLSRIEAGREELEISKFKVSRLVSELVDMIKPQAVEKNIDLQFSLEDESVEIASDYEKCRHILQNLVANAVKFTEVGKVEIRVERKGETVQISVIDSGIGISKEHLPHIFDEFRQADGSSSRKYGGTGLGLAIAKKYARLLKGSIKVESIHKQGSTFVLSLPVQISNSGGNYIPYQPEMIRSSQSYSAFKPGEKTILLVEDTEPIIFQMNDVLVSHGYNVMIARNGAEALAQIENQIPDGMILDLMMPDVDGFEVLKRIRENDRTDHLPVIILTAKYVTKEELAFLKHNGIQQLIRKGDINKEQLLEAVSRMVIRNSDKIETTDQPVIPKPISGDPVVLVIEDNSDNMLTIKALLDGNFKILEAVDGKTAIMMALKNQPHLILMDFALPEMNGAEALTEIRKHEKLNHIPVIAVSASAMKGDRENFIAMGFNDYISKPIDHVIFEQTIQKWLIYKTN